MNYDEWKCTPDDPERRRKRAENFSRRFISDINREIYTQAKSTESTRKAGTRHDD